jgi:hypothetical protein
LCRDQGHFPAYRWRACEGYDTRLTGTVLAKTRPRPAPLVLLRRGLAQGEPTARLARELGLSRTQLHPLRPRLQTHRHDTAPTDVLAGTAFEAEALDHNAGGNHARPIATPSIRPVGAPISAKGMAPLPPIVPP